MLEYKAGTLIYIDTFSGLIKGKYIRYLTHTGHYPNMDMLIVKITSKTNSAYHCGEITTFNIHLVYPRELFHRSHTSPFKFYLTSNFKFI